MRFWLLLLAGCLSSLAGQDAREIVRRSVELDQMNWLRMADYTWTARSLEKHLDSQNRVTSEHEEGWETIVLGGEPYRHDLERDGKPLPSGQQKREQEKLDRLAARLEKETPEQKQHRLAEYANKRRREREFLLEIPEAFDLRREPDEEIDGQDVWVISGVPNPAYHAKSRDARALAKIRGKLWIEKSGYQWVRVEAETTATISFGVFLARLNPGARLVFEQARVNDEIWLPRREFLSGSGRIGMLKRLAESDEILWSNYRKFQVDSRVLP